MSREEARPVARVRRSLRQGRLRAGIDQVMSWAGREGGQPDPVDSPASFPKWVPLRSARPPAPYQQHWRQVSAWKAGQAARIGVLVHVYYADLLPEILDQLAAIPVPFDLIITNSSGKTLHIPDDIGARQLLLTNPNHGRDILPLLDVVNADLLNPYDLVLKVHTKNSQWRAGHDLPGDGADWRTELLDALLGSTENVSAIMDAFAGDRGLGMVTADGSVLGPEYWGDNEEVCAHILRRMELTLEPSNLVFASGSMYWSRGIVLAGLRALNLGSDDFETEAGQVNSTTAHAVERIIGVLCTEAGLSIVGRSDVPAGGAGGVERYAPAADGPEPRVRAIPFFLPQFHPIPENDAWWGHGFTEWANVASARPIYRGHYQPRLPRDLGFYDLRLPEVTHAQCELAEETGLGGFMYYHYWFSGKKLLELPIESRLASDDALPFCLMWANENWTRTWSGGEEDILLAQNYDDVPATEFITAAMDVLRDPRYLRVDGKAVLAVYRPAQLPDVQNVVLEWRQRARDAGIGELLLLAVDVGYQLDGLIGDFRSFGFDGTLGFPPHNHFWDGVDISSLGLRDDVHPRILSYRALAREAMLGYRDGIDDAHYPGVMVAFDNTARRQTTPDIWYGANPYTYFRWLSAAADAVMDRSPDQRIVFINAWNEWAEGAVLEPNDRFGSSYLVATRTAISG